MNNLKVIMAEHEVTATQLSEDIGISKTTITSYSKGRVKRIDIDRMLEIADYFNVTLDELFGRVAYVVPVRVGKRIKEIRIKEGLTQKEFAEQTDSTIPAVSNWENGRNLPNKRRLKAIAKIGNITTEELMS